jgi:hypothetical protein
MKPRACGTRLRLYRNGHGGECFDLLDGWVWMVIGVLSLDCEPYLNHTERLQVKANVNITECLPCYKCFLCR